MKFKNWIANLPLYVGAYVHNFATGLEYFGVQLHIWFKTPVGIKAAAMKRLLEEMAATMQKENTAHKTPAREEDKLSAALSSGNMNQGVGAETDKTNVVLFGRKDESKD